METAVNFLGVLASNSLWLAGSGLVLWLCLRSRLQLAPGTRAVASVLIVLHGWIWMGIPVPLDIPAPLNLAWKHPKPAAIPAPNVTPTDVAQALAPLPLTPTDSPAPHAAPIEVAHALAPLPLDSALPAAANSLPEAIQLAAAALAAIWMAGIAILLVRSIHGFLELSGMVHALPRAPVAWQQELSALCRRQKIGSPLVLKISNVTSPMLVQTWGRTCIVVPAWLWESCTAGQRRSILLHELAHYQRGDIWRQLAVRLLVLPHWFNPVAWWAARQFEAAGEAACDEVACGDDPLEAISYSKALLLLNEHLGVRYAQALAISGGSLTERIRRVLHPEYREESQMSKVLILSVMILLAGLATIRIQAADQAPTSKSEAAENEAAKAPGVTLRRRTITEEYEKAEPAKATPVSLLANGGFEESQDDSDDPEAWFATRWPKTPGHYLLAASKSVAHSGKRSVVVEIGASHPDTRVDYNWTAVAKEWKAGETYELSGWIKVANAKLPAVIMVQFWSEEGKDGKMIGGATTQFSDPVKGTTDWTRVSTRFVVPEGTGLVRIRAALSSQNNSGAKAWFDDLSLVAVSRSANESNKNQLARNEAATASLASLVANGSFENLQESSNDPQAWFATRVPHTAGHFQLASSSSVAHSGKRSAALQIGESHPDSPVHYNWTTDIKDCKPGETYVLSGWIKVENAKSPAFLMAQCLSEDGKRIVGYSQRPCNVTGTADWTRVSTPVKVPEGAGIIRIRAGLTSKDNHGAKAWLDDISLVKAPTATN
jgi:beta-lactamase regulating signal transducer with metallopeptidase domain